MREKLKMLPLLSDLEIEMNTYRTEIERLEELAQTSQELEDELRSQIEDYKAEIEKLSANSREVRFVSFFSSFYGLLLYRSAVWQWHGLEPKATSLFS